MTVSPLTATRTLRDAVYDYRRSQEIVIPQATADIWLHRFNSTLHTYRCLFGDDATDRMYQIASDFVHLSQPKPMQGNQS